MLGHPGPHSHQAPQVDDRRKHHALHRDLLNAMQQGLPLGPVALHRLLLKERIDVGIAPIALLNFTERCVNTA